MVWSAVLAVLFARLTLPLEGQVAPRPASQAAVVALLGQLAIGALVLRPWSRWALFPVALSGQWCAWVLTFVVYLLADGDPPANVPYDAGPIAIAAGLFAVPVGVPN